MCVVNELCNINIKQLLKRGKTKFGIVFNLDNQYYTSDSNSVSYVSIAIDSAGNETASSDTLMVIYDQRKPELVKYLLPDHPDSTIWIGDGSLRFDFLFSEKLTNKIS